VIADFEQTVHHLLTRVNTRTGVPYRDDPAIFGWETGNELDSPPAWSRRIAALMKQLDPNHLVIDGRSMHGVPPDSLDDPNIDVITTHHYPNTDDDYVKVIVAAREKTRGKKPYFVGEFGFTPADKIEQVYDAVIDNGVSGALIWSLRFHHRDGGFFWHFEPLGGRLYKAYHWPGFDTGEAYEERRVMQLTREKAFKIRGLELPPPERPTGPTLLSIEDPATISWQGSAGAVDYIVQRAPKNDGPWSIVGDGVDDTEVQYRPLFNDQSAMPGESYYYRVIARNRGGRSAPSNIVGPVQVCHRTLIDEGQDLSRLASDSGAKPTTGDDRRRREDIHRLSIPAGAYVTYVVQQPINSWKAILFRVDDSGSIKVSYSTDGKKFEPGDADLNEGPKDAGDYGYLQQLDFSSTTVPAAARALRLESVDGTLELSRIEIRYAR